MVSAQLLSHEDAFINNRLLEEKEKLAESDLYGFAVGFSGKRFTLVKDTDDIISKIWFVVLEFFGLIESDADAIGKLKECTENHLKKESYKNWPENIEGERISEIAIQRLFEKADATSLPPSNEPALKEEISCKEKDIAELKKEITQRQESESKKEQKISTLEKEIEDLKEKMSERDSEKDNGKIEELETKVDELRAELLAKEKKVNESEAKISHLTKRKNHYKKENKQLSGELKKEQDERSVAEAAWSALTEGLDPNTFLTDKEEYLEKTRSGLHRTLFGDKKARRKSTSGNLHKHVRVREKAKQL